MTVEGMRACLVHPHRTLAAAAGPVEYADRGGGTPLLAVHGTLGGPAAYALAARHPKRVARLLQVDSVCLPIPPFPLARLASRDLSIRLQLWFLRHAAGSLLKKLLRRFGDVDSGAEAHNRAARVAANPIRVAHQEFKTMSPMELEAIACPALIMHGTADASVPPEYARHAHRHIRGSELYWMQGSHVAFFLEEGDTAPVYALEWLRGYNPTRLPAAGGSR